jgi:hypothetical protein
VDSAVVPAGSCPHLAMILPSREEVWPVLASFYALGAKRNGWLVHRTVDADADRAALAAAGLDVAALEAAGRMAFDLIGLDITVAEYVHAWEPQLEAALARGFDAAWWARFPIGPDAKLLDRSVEYEAAWDAHFHDKPCVSLCVFIVGDVDRERRFAEIAVNHDSVLRA